MTCSRSDIQKQIEEVAIYLSTPSIPKSQRDIFNARLTELQTKLEEISHG